ncbi:MAG: hypothetical protein GY810_29770 [Aureispira sp.]|nr:hypothetical protein [Aureispira sp.]
MDSKQIDLLIAVLFGLATLAYLFLGYWGTYKQSHPSPKLQTWHKRFRYITFVAGLFPLITALGALLVVLLFFEIS